MMTLESISEAVREAGELLRADGADLLLIDFDAEESRVHVSVSIADANCAECVIPPDLLAVVVSDVINRNLSTPVHVVVDDPRTT